MSARTHSRPAAYLQLSRLSNLPTVWTNTLAGALLAGSAAPASVLFLAAGALSLMYIGGMFLNDAFDRGHDAIERPARPIPSGAVAAGEVFAVGYLLLALGTAACAVLSHAWASSPWPGLLSSAALALTIVVYNAWHKGNPAGPLLMGLCRGLVYVTAGLGLGGSVGAGLVLGALAAVLYVLGLTEVAKREGRRSTPAWVWALVTLPAGVAILARLETPSVEPLGGWIAVLIFLAWTLKALHPRLRNRTPSLPNAVVGLIAGISLVDGLFLAVVTVPGWALGIAGLVLTLGMQKLVSGT